MVSWFAYEPGGTQVDHVVIDAVNLRMAGNEGVPWAIVGNIDAHSDFDTDEDGQNDSRVRFDVAFASNTQFPQVASTIQ